MIPQTKRPPSRLFCSDKAKDSRDLVRSPFCGAGEGNIPPSRTPSAPPQRSSILDCGFPGGSLIIRPDPNPTLSDKLTSRVDSLFAPREKGHLAPFQWSRCTESLLRTAVFSTVSEFMYSISSSFLSHTHQTGDSDAFDSVHWRKKK